MLDVKSLPENAPFVYPIARRGKVSGAIVLFYDWETVVCIKEGGTWSRGETYHQTTNHEDTKVWEPVEITIKG
jgi:hypothetical protein